MKRSGTITKNADPILKQGSAEIQQFGTVAGIPIDLDERVREENSKILNQILSDTMTLRDLYKKCHWQAAGPAFYQFHLLFDKHYNEQVELADLVAERVQTLGGVSIAMAADVAETTKIERPPRGREDMPSQLQRVLDAHRVILGEVRQAIKQTDDNGDFGTNDLLVSEVLRTNEIQVWFISEHLVDVPLLNVGTGGLGERAA